MRHFTFTTLFACALATGCATAPKPHGVVKAAESYRKAAEQGNVLAQESLGSAYELGQGVAMDYTEAAKWYRKAAEHRGTAAASAQYSFAECYEHGKGVEQDFIEAYKWYNIAAGNDFSLAAVYRDQIAQLMTPQQIAEGQRRASEFVAEQKTE